MFNSLPNLEIAVESTLRDYSEWTAGPMEKILDARRTGKPSLRELSVVHEKLTQFKSTIDSLRSDNKYNTVKGLLKEDLDMLSEELDVAIDELADMTHPEEAWAKAPASEKAKISKEMRVELADGELITARLKMKIRKQKGKPERVYQKRRGNV